MSYYACIFFNEDKILLSKVKFEETTFQGVEGFNVYVPMPYEHMTPRGWFKLENQLIEYNIEYVVMESKENPFESITVVNGNRVRRFMSRYILEYIYKYKLIQVSQLYANVGIIPGRVDETMEVIANIVEHVTDLTFLLDEPIVYKEIISEIYKQTRLKSKAKVPSSVALKEMDIIFDLSGSRNYAKWCKPNTIYIDFKDGIGKRHLPIEGSMPSIWYEFEVRCGKQCCSLELVEAVLFSQGFYKESITNELRKMRLTIDKVHARCIS
ncbi:MAG: hypothetical protein ACRCSG_06390 [Cellulosilyticaceae bacterium]